MDQSLLSRNLIVLVMLALAGVGWLLEAYLDLVEWFYLASRPYEGVALDGLVPGILLVLVGAFLDTYRAHQRSLLERERLVVMMEMAATIAHEVNDPLTTLIAHLELTGEELDTGHPVRDRLASMREAAWRIAERIKQINEVRAYRPHDVGVAPRLLDLSS